MPRRHYMFSYSSHSMHNVKLSCRAPRGQLKRLVMCILSVDQYFIKNGRAMKTMPTRIIVSTLGTKYGKAHKATPDRRAMPFRCFFPYTKYAMPNEPNNKLHIILAELSMGVSCLFLFSYFTHNVWDKPLAGVPASRP